jgi:alpha-galactosidase
MTYKITLIGAGSANFGLGTLGDFLKSKVLAGSTIALHDINEESLLKVAKIGERYIQEQGLPYTLQATTNLTEALQGSNFCIISIEVGNRFELWEQDWKFPSNLEFASLWRKRRPGWTISCLEDYSPYSQYL